MTTTTNISIRMDKELKEQADTVFNDLGMNMTTAFNIFVRQTLRQGKIPFEIYTDPFYSTKNQAHLQAIISDYETGKKKPIIKTMAELENMTANG